MSLSHPRTCWPRLVLVLALAGIVALLLLGLAQCNGEEAAVTSASASNGVTEMREAVERFKSNHALGGELFTFAIIPHPTEQGRDSDSLIASLRDDADLGELRRITRAKVLAAGVTSTTSEEEVLVRRFWDGGGRISHNWLVIARLQRNSAGHASLSPVFWCHWSLSLKSSATPRDIAKVLTRFADQDGGELIPMPRTTEGE